MTKSLDEIMSARGEPAPEQTPIVEAKPEAPASDAKPAPDQDRVAQHEAGEADQQGMVPQAALHAERQKAKRYTEQVADMQSRMDAMNREWQQRFDQILAMQQRPAQQAPQTEPPDWYQDPNAAFQHNVAPIQQQFAQTQEQFSKMLAEDKFGSDAVQSAYQAFSSHMRSNPNAQFEYQRIMSSPHPYGELVKWHKSQTVLSEFGDDPKAAREKLRAEILAEIASGRPGNTPIQQAAQPPVLPTNFAGARSAAPNSAATFTGPRPLSEIMGR